MNLEKKNVGLAVGGVFALWHFLWSMLVALGLAQAFLDWILWMHFMNNPFRIESFSLARTVILVIVTFIIGYLLGWAFASLWNWLHRHEEK